LHCFKALGLMACASAIAVAQGAQPASQVELEKIRQGVQRNNQADPPKPWQIPRVSHYEIQVGSEGQLLFAPGYHDKDSGTFHRWKGIAFPAKESPYRNPYRRMLTLDPREEKYRSTDFDPPISYLTVAPDQLAPGYHVPNQSAFYRWKDVTIQRDELPAGTPTVLSANERDNTVLIAVAAPKHLLAKPELWKKAKK